MELVSFRMMSWYDWFCCVFLKFIVFFEVIILFRLSDIFINYWVVRFIRLYMIWIFFLIIDCNLCCRKFLYFRVVCFVLEVSFVLKYVWDYKFSFWIRVSILYCMLLVYIVNVMFWMKCIYGVDFGFFLGWSMNLWF